ncbi:MAG: intradiol ring-cleavage dioxygenase [Maritimibacter sp.]|nr:intradiol ring-cleavage dioxygenase [Maritimibacter sp.]
MTNPNRRTLLMALAASPVAAAGVGAFPRAVRAEAAAIGLVTPNVCLVAPETTEGPYYFDPALERSDVTEGKAGVPMALTLQVVDANCVPLEGARVDIWHCDAQGNYSGYATQGSDGTLDTQGETFLRGTQMTDGRGVAQFATIYPGWYRGRTTHIHYKVFLDETTVLTSQIFFPDALSEYLFLNVDAYMREATRDTVNANDGIAQAAGDGAYAAIREQSERYVAELVVGVDPAAVSTEGAGPGAGGPPPGSDQAGIGANSGSALRLVPGVQG